MAEAIPTGGIGGFIRDQRRRAGLSVRRLAHLAGVSNPYLSQIERGLRTPSAVVLRAIGRALRIPTETMYARAGILDDTAPSGLVDAIRSAPELTEPQKRALIDHYRSYRAPTG